MKAKLEACYERLQKMTITATLENMEIMVQTLYDLRDMYHEAKEEDEGGRNPAGSE